MAHRTTVVVLLVGVVITGALSAAAWSVHDGNEDRLLRQRTQEAGVVLASALPSVRRPLTSAAVLAEATDANPVVFASLVSPMIDTAQFTSVSVWELDGLGQGAKHVVGADPALAAEPEETISAALGRARSTQELVIVDRLTEEPPAIGYAVAASSAPGEEAARYVVYAESTLPEDRTTLLRLSEDEAFSGLHAAVYIGMDEDADHLLFATTKELPLEGRRAIEEVAFGDSRILLVMSPAGELGGQLLARLAMIVGLVGTLASIGTAFLVERLLRRRDHAVELAQENRRLYAGQRTVAEQLQQSLLPEVLPDLPGLALAARYEPGTEGLDIGGDWYDVVSFADDRVVLVVGDVSGRGIEAATVMASLRHGIRAFASQGDDPATILGKLCRLVSIERDGHFATVLLALVDVPERRVTLADAGHPAPLVVEPGAARFVEVPVGPPVGATTGVDYRSVTVEVPSGAALLAFTDGLYERRGETVDDGLERLRAAAAASGSIELDALLDDIVRQLAPSGAEDDTAIVGMQWR